MFGLGEKRSAHKADASGCSVRARTEVCARKDGYSSDDIVSCYVGMIRVYWA